MDKITASPYFGIILSIFAYELALLIRKKVKLQLANPLLIGIIIVIAVLKIFNIPLKNYDNGGQIISLFLAPTTACIAIPIYNYYKELKKNILPIFLGTFVGSIVSITSVIFLCKLLNVDNKITASLIPKSVTTPIAIEIAAKSGGIIPITVTAVIITGIMGAIFCPILIKLFKPKNSIAVGIAIGTSSHAVGTTKAMEIGEIEGAMSGISIGMAGLITVIMSIFL